MSKIEIQSAILRAVQQLNELQQIRLLEFITAMTVKKKKQPVNPLLQFAGYFPSEDLQQMKIAIEDCEKIDVDGW